MGQSLEIIPVACDDEGVIWLKPIHAPSLRVGVSPSRGPGDTILGVLARYDLEPIVVHSTSWRTEGDRMILTYLAVVPVVPVASDGPLEARRVGRADLARGQATAAPEVIDIEQVIEHGLRHLAWLVRDDPAISEALASWRSALDGYVPEPFRAFQG